MVFTSKNLFESACSSVVLIGTYRRLDISTSASESASGGSTDDKQDSNCPIEPHTGYNNVFTHYEESHGYDSISHALSYLWLVQVKL